MSSSVTKVAYRFRVPELDGVKGATALAYFRERFGEPESSYEDDGEADDYFSYGSLNLWEKNPEGFRSFVFPVRSLHGKQWGVEVVLGLMDHGLNAHLGLTPKVMAGHGLGCELLMRLLDELESMGFDREEVANGKFHAYTWYTGGDEPVTFD